MIRAGLLKINSRQFVGLVIFCSWLALAIAGVTPANASEKKEGESSGGLVRHTIWIPLISPGTQTVIKTIPIIIEIHSTTDEAKNYFTERMPIIQDSYISRLYGKVFSNIGHDTLVDMIDKAVDAVTPEEYHGLYSVSVQINPKPQ